MTPNVGTADAAAGAATAKVSAAAAGAWGAETASRASVLPSVDGAAEAGRANVARSPPDATATADAFMAGCAERAAMPLSSLNGL